MKLLISLLATCFTASIGFGQTDPAPAVPLGPPLPDESASASVHNTEIEMPHAVAKPIAVRVVGSNVKNLAGEYLGLVDNIVIDGESGRTELAMLLVNYPKNQSRYTPVPWGNLGYVWDQSQEGGVPGALQVFLLNLDKATLERAPVVDRSQWSLIREPQFAQQLASFYGMTDTSAVGGPGLTSGTVVGGGSGGVAATASVPAGGVVAGVTDPFFLSPGFIALVETNVVGTNIIIVTNIVNVTNRPPEGTNIVGGTNLFTPRGSNLVPTAPFGGRPGFATNFPPRVPMGDGTAAGVGAGIAPGTGNRGVLPPTGRPFTPTQPPFRSRQPLPPTRSIPQVPPPPASPVVPTVPGSVQQPPGAVVPPVPTTPAPAVPSTPPQ